MQSSIWKIIALLGVVAIGLLVIFQAQLKLKGNGATAAAETDADDADPTAEPAEAQAQNEDPFASDAPAKSVARAEEGSTDAVASLKAAEKAGLDLLSDAAAELQSVRKSQKPKAQAAARTVAKEIEEQAAEPREVAEAEPKRTKQAERQARLLKEAKEKEEEKEQKADKETEKEEEFDPFKSEEEPKSADKPREVAEKESGEDLVVPDFDAAARVADRKPRRTPRARMTLDELAADADDALKSLEPDAKSPKTAALTLTDGVETDEVRQAPPADESGAEASNQIEFPGAGETVPLPQPATPSTPPATPSGAAPAPTVDNPAAKPAPLSARQETLGQPAGNVPGQPALAAPPAQTPSLAPPPAGPAATAGAPSDAAPRDPRVGADGNLLPAGSQPPQITIEKKAPDNAVLGQPLIYAIVVRNVGLTRVQQVVVEDVVPEGCELHGTKPRAELTEKKLIWRIGTLQPSEEHKILVRVIPRSEGDIGSIATVNYVSEVATKTRITSPKLELSMSCPKQVRQGDAVPVTFKITNIGSADATQVVLRDVLSEALQHEGGNDLENSLGTIPAGQSREIQLTLTASQKGTAVNHAYITADGNIAIEDEVRTEVVGPQLTIHRKGPQRLYLNHAAAFVNTVKNEGTLGLTDVVIVEQVPAGFQYVSATPEGQFDAARRAFVWRLPKLGAGAQVTLNISLMPKAKGLQSSTIRVFDAAREHAASTTEASVEGLPVLTVDTSDATAPLAVGESINYQIRVHNRGSEEAGNTQIRVTLPDELKLIEADAPVAHRQQGKQLIFESIPHLIPQDRVQIRLRLEAASAGDSRIRIQIQGDHMQKPLSREESIVIISGQE